MHCSKEGQGQATGSKNWDVVSITDTIMDLNYYRRGREVVFQLYLYPDDNSLDSSRVTNLDMTIVKDIEKSSGLKPVAKPYPRRQVGTPLKKGIFPFECQSGGLWSRSW